MWSIQKNVSVGANATIGNQLSGEQFEFLPYDSHVEVLGSIAATGLSYDLFANNELIMSGTIPNIKTGNNPVYPDDILASFDAAAGTRLVLKIVNSTGGAIVGTYIVRGTGL